MGVCFVFITMVLGQQMDWTKEVCLYTGADWLKLVCQSGGGKRSILAQSSALGPTYFHPLCCPFLSFFLWPFMFSNPAELDC